MYMAKTMLKNEVAVVGCASKKCCAFKCMGFWLTLVPMSVGTLAFFVPNPSIQITGIITTAVMALGYNLFSYLHKKN